MKIYKLQGNTAPDEFVLFISQMKAVLYPTKNLEIDSIQKITKLMQHFMSLFVTKNVFKTFLFYLFSII